MLHKNLGRIDIHRVVSYTYADQSSREAATGFTEDDVEKLARQLDDDSIWMLINHNPIEWQFLGGGGASTHSRAHSLTSTLDHSDVTSSPSDGDILRYNGSYWSSLKLHPYSNEIHVSYSNGDDTNGDGSLSNPYKTIGHALSTITDNSETNRYAILIHQGVYQESNPLNLKPYVAVTPYSAICSVKVIAQNSASPIISACNNGYIGRLDLYGATQSPAIYMDSSGCFLAEQVQISNCQSGIHTNHANAKIAITTAILSDGNTSITKAFNAEHGSIFVVDSFILDQDLIIDKYISADSSDSEIKAINIYFDSTNVNNFVYLNNDATVRLFSSFAKDASIGIHMGDNGGLFVADGVQMASRDLDIKIDSTNGIFIGNNICVGRDKIEIPDDVGFFSNFGFDKYSMKLRSLSNTAIGRSGVGQTFEAGEGGPYKHGITIYTWDGGSYTTQDPDSTFSFPSTSAGNAIYFGDELHRFYGLGYVLNQPISLGAGEIVWEYYDGGSATWVEFNTLNTIELESRTSSNRSFDATAGDACTVRFDHNIKIGVTESNASATGWAKTNVSGITAYWIRCRISSAISQSPTISSIRLKGNYTQIRPNGTQSHHGDCRSIKIVPIALGAGISGSTSNQTVSVSQRIDIPLRENKLNNGVTDRTYFRLILPSEIDTSWGIEVEIEWCTSSSSSSDRYAKIHLTHAFGRDGARFDGSETDYEQIATFSTSGGDPSWKRYVSTFPKRIDISELVPGDTIFCEIKRLTNESGDTLAGPVVITNGKMKYRIWQTGEV